MTDETNENYWGSFILRLSIAILIFLMPILMILTAPSYISIIILSSLIIWKLQDMMRKSVYMSKRSNE